MSGSISSDISMSLVLGGIYFTASSAGVTTNLNSTIIIVGDIASNAVTTPTLVTSTVAAQTLYGSNSTLAGMISNYLTLDRLSTVYAVPAPSANSAGVAAGLTSLGQMPVGFVVYPMYDAETAVVVDSFLNENTGRWNYTSQLMGKGISAVGYNAANTTALLTDAASNSKYITTFGLPNSSPTSVANAAAMYAGVLIPQVQANPGIPLNGLVLPIAAPAITDVPSFSVQNTLETAGISTFTTNAAGQLVLRDAVTMHTTDSNGNPDNSWAKFTAICELEFVIRSFLALYPVYFQGKKIVTDDSLAVAGTIFITTNSVRSTFINAYQALAEQGMVVDVPSFTAKSGGVQVQNVGGGRFNVYLPITLASGLEIVALNVKFTNS